MQWSIKQGSTVYLFLSTGLLDVPICSVNDDGALSNPRYSHPQFPPSNHEDQKIQQYARYYNVPVNAINVNSQRHPINTITGLQYFQGKALNMRIFKEKAVPKVGMGKCRVCVWMQWGI